MTTFWTEHNFLFLICILFLPRLTVLFLTPFPIGIDQILGWAFAPRFLITYFAWLYYWDTNPILVILAGVNAVAVLLAWNIWLRQLIDQFFAGVKEQLEAERTKNNSGNKSSGKVNIITR